jgi:hypothetical protein
MNQKGNYSAFNLVCLKVTPMVRHIPIPMCMPGSLQANMLTAF